MNNDLYARILLCLRISVSFYIQIEKIEKYSVLKNKTKTKWNSMRLKKNDSSKTSTDEFRKMCIKYIKN